MADTTHTPPADDLLALSLGDLNPLNWLGDQVAGVAADGWKAAMIGLWSAGLWLLQMAFKVIDDFTTPDLFNHCPKGTDLDAGGKPLPQIDCVPDGGALAGALPTTLWLGGSIAVVMMFLQLVTALVRRDGQSLGRVALGVLQFGAVWVGFLAVGGGLIAASGALARGILSALLDVGSWSQYSAGDSWPREVSDATTATVLGVCSFLMLIPAAFAYLIVMLVREAALIILLVTTPITAGGLVNDSTKSWFWKSLRWFVASLLVAPAAALILGIGVSLSGSVVNGAGEDATAAVGTAVVGCVLVLIGAVCPMVLFKLLAFVDPGTGSGAAMRQSMSDAGGLSGLMGGGKSGGSGGSSAAAQSDGGGRSAGEASAETAGTSRMAGAMGALGAGIGMATSMATRAADVASDVLGQAGIGDPGYSAGFADNAAKQRGGGGMSPSSGGSDGPDQGGMQPSGPGAEPPQGPSPQIGTGDLPGGPAGPMPSGGGAGGGGAPTPGGGGGGGGAGGAAGGGVADAAVLAL